MQPVPNRLFSFVETVGELLLRKEPEEAGEFISVHSSQFGENEREELEKPLKMGLDHFVNQLKNGTLRNQRIVLDDSLEWDRHYDIERFLKELPAGLQVGRNLNLSRCTSLTALPKGLQVDRDLNLEECTCLRGLPEGLHVGGDLNLRGCLSLTSLPAGLTVGERLNLSGCRSLTSLPAGLTVGRDLSLNSCTSLTSLPAGLNLGGYLNLSHCTSLT